MLVMDNIYNRAFGLVGIWSSGMILALEMFKMQLIYQ
ncbi:BnaC03g58840D [Brassica napus]|uniref:Uncharacterized protein n=2 Tax=Brassica TaxID=3705 RepID=A0A3P6BU60_BRACM|nr:unnamed protein product [Brassica napus]CAF2252078.1 unnamed protein product [Brassica napus]CDY43312.1 BnaC03g58840D [Brassica napus]VDD06316.1 unnamed protein product [Brassica rapa]